MTEAGTYTKRLSVVGICLLTTALASLASMARPQTAAAHEASDHLAETPPMGWNSWNAFGNGAAGHPPKRQ